MAILWTLIATTFRCLILCTSVFRRLKGRPDMSLFVILEVQDIGIRFTSAFSGTLPYITPECCWEDPVEKPSVTSVQHSSLIFGHSQLYSLNSLPRRRFSVQTMNWSSARSGRITVESKCWMIANKSIQNFPQRGIGPEFKERPSAEEMIKTLFNRMTRN